MRRILIVAIILVATASCTQKTIELLVPLATSAEGTLLPLGTIQAVYEQYHQWVPKQ